MELHKLRDKAAEAFAKGKFAKAGELYTEYCQSDKKDMQARLRMGDAWAKAGDKKKAVEAYRVAAETFAKDGFLPRAIAASKLILELEPSHQSMQKMLADLYAQRTAPRGDQTRRKREPIDLPPEDPELQLGPGSAPPEAAVVAPAAPAQIELRVEEQVLSLTEDWSKELPPELEVADADARISADRATEPASLAKVEAKMGGRESSASPSRFDELDLDDAGIDGVSRSAGEPETFLQAVESAAHSQRRPTAIEERIGSLDPNECPPSGLPKIPLFSDLPADAFIQLFERCPLRRVKKGECIIEQGEFGNAFYVICAGSVRIYRQEGGNRADLAMLGEGTFFGEMALLSGAQRTASVEASSEETQLLEISAPVLEQLSRQFPSIADALKKFCRQRLLTNVMNTSAFFQPFDRKDRRDLVERFRAREVRRGETVVQEGQQSDGLFVILSGEVEVRKSGNVVAKLKEGDIFGEISLLQKSPASASVVSSKRTSLLRLPREEFDALIMSHPQLLVLVSELTDDRLRQNDAVMQGVAVLGDEGLMLV